MPFTPRPPIAVADAARSVRPRSGRIKAAQAYSGFGRSKLYEEAAKNPGLFRKSGTAVIVDYDILDEIISALPAAVIKPPKPRPARANASPVETA
jgi:hypothetical protein